MEEELAETARSAVPTTEGTRVKRKLVQAMLFPHNGKTAGGAGIVTKDDNEGDHRQNDDVHEEYKEEEEEEEEEEWCGSQKGKKKRGRKPKTANSKPRASQKKVKANEKDGSKIKRGDGDSTDVAKSDFFTKASERQYQKRQQSEKVCIVSDGENDRRASPSTTSADIKASRQLKRQANSTPQKHRLNSTPKKNSKGRGPKGACSEQTSPSLLNADLALQPLPNLRLEAKFMAEENLRIYAGRQIHPFFSSRKLDKKNQEIIDLETEQCSFERERKGISFNPIHVYERLENDAITLDWKHWTFSETSAANSSCALESGWSSIFEGTAKPLRFNNYLGVSQLNETILCPNEIAIDPRFNLQKEDQGQGINIVDCFPEYSGCITPSAEWQGRFLHESCHHHPENCLWTDKYQPGKAMQVCGNGEAVKRLSEWLNLWYEWCSQTNKTVKPDGNSIVGDHSCYYQSDCDSENMDEETALKNVLLITGPVGSGKSAAIYACAKEQGFQVIEVNASDWRNGTLVKQRFGEAVESHWVQGAVVNPATSDIKDQTKSFSFVSAKKSEVIELIPLSDEEDSECTSAGLPKSSCNENRTANIPNKLKTLILFEDVDATLCEDYGFISTIQQLAKTAKRPMILTSNSEHPFLPSNLDRLHLCFTIPSVEELAGLARVVCAAEEARIHPCLVEHFVNLCQGDIRKSIMHLQFWCQGQNYRQGYSCPVNESLRMQSPHLFDIDASHWVLPKIVPWSLPSRLSELVAEEITKSLIIMERNNNPMNVAMEEDLNKYTQNFLTMHDTDHDNIEAKKEAMLSLHWSIEDDDEHAAPSEPNFDFYGFLDSPVADTQQHSRKKFSAVIFSDSEEEYFTEQKAAVSRRMLDNTDDEALEEKSTAPSPSLASERCCTPSTELLNPFGGDKLEEYICQCAETVDCSHMNGTCIPVNVSCLHCSHINDTCKSINISCVPESLIVPETEFDNQTDLSSKTVNYEHASYEVASDSPRKETISNLVAVEVKKSFKSFPMSYENQDTFGSGCHLSSKAGNQDVVGDSQFDHVDDVPRGYQVLDECSRVDFIRGSESLLNPISHYQIDLVQETWQKLRDCKMDLRQHVTQQERDAFEALKITFELSNLISEADVLLNDCQPLLCDYLDPLMTPCDGSHSYNWHDHQLQMSSIFAEHGISFYAKETTTLGPQMLSSNSVDLAWEMMASSTSLTALGKLVSLESTMIDSSKMKLPGSFFRLKSRKNSRLSNVLQCVAPLKSYLSLQGDACYEYLSSLSQISRLETTRISEHIDKRKRRRARVARHYLNSGSFTLTSEDISFLGQYDYQQLST